MNRALSLRKALWFIRFGHGLYALLSNATFELVETLN